MAAWCVSIHRAFIRIALRQLKASGVDDVRTFRWLEVPDARALERAETLLADLGAIEDTTGAITPLGRRMLVFPVHPRYARMLLAAQEFGCVRPVALIAALTQGRDLLARRQGAHADDGRDELFDGETESDFFVLMRAWRFAEQNGFHMERCRRLGINAQAARQVGPLFEQFLRIAAEEGLDIGEKLSPNNSTLARSAVSSSMGGAVRWCARAS